MRVGIVIISIKIIYNWQKTLTLLLIVISCSVSKLTRIKLLWIFNRDQFAKYQNWEWLGRYFYQKNEMITWLLFGTHKIIERNICRFLFLIFYSFSFYFKTVSLSLGYFSSPLWKRVTEPLRLAIFFLISL